MGTGSRRQLSRAKSAGSQRSKVARDDVEPAEIKLRELFVESSAAATYSSHGNAGGDVSWLAISRFSKVTDELKHSRNPGRKVSLTPVSICTARSHSLF